jgi:hypothetical protein
MNQRFRSKLLIAALATALATGAYAQKPTQPEPKPPTPAPQTPPGPNPTPPPGPGPHTPPPAPQSSPPTGTTAVVPTTLPGTPQTSPAIPATKPFNAVVKDATEIPGFFTLYEKDEKVWIELKPEQLNTPFYLSVNRTRGLGENFIYPFMVRGYVVEFRKIGGLVQMIAKNTRFGAKAGTPLALAAEQSFTDSLLASTTVASQPHPERKSILIEANGLFLTDIPGTATQLEAAYRAPYSFDQRNSSFTKVRATPDMATFAVSAHFAMPKVPAPQPTVKRASPPVALPGPLAEVRSMVRG